MNNENVTFSESQNQALELQSQKKILPFIPKLGIVLFFGSVATIIFMLVRRFIFPDITKHYYPLIAYPFNIAILYIFFHKKAKYPVEVSDFRTFLSAIGIKLDKLFWKYCILGLILGVMSLSGMLIGSILTNRYEFNWDQLELEQILFSLVPGIWEEVFYRGLMMLVLLKVFKAPWKAIFVQSIIFGLAHFRGFGLWELVDIISTIIIGFTVTYVAYKTNSLIPGMIFHFLHDAFIFLVQVPKTITLTNMEHLIFFACLWAFQGLICVITWLFNKYLLPATEKTLYSHE